MGEIAEMMLDGTLCSQCGEVLIDFAGGEPQGFPGLCDSCAGHPANKQKPRKRKRTQKRQR